MLKPTTTNDFSTEDKKHVVHNLLIIYIYSDRLHCTAVIDYTKVVVQIALEIQMELKSV